MSRRVKRFALRLITGGVQIFFAVAGAWTTFKFPHPNLVFFTLMVSWMTFLFWTLPRQDGSNTSSANLEGSVRAKTDGL